LIGREIYMSQYIDTTRPMDYDTLLAATAHLKNRYEFLQSFACGKSVLGRSLIAFVIGNGVPGALYVGTHHSLEYITAMLLFEFTEQLCEHMESGELFFGYDVQSMLKAQTICIIPMLNPDGVELCLKGIKSAGSQKDNLKKQAGNDYSDWQANAHGVDLNHNYSAGWDILRRLEINSGITGPAPRRYGGVHAESEPETHALCNLCRRIPFSRAYAMHSQGEEIYYSYGSRTPKISLQIAEKLAAVCSYKIAEPELLASHGGFKDWFINVFGRPAFTIEVGSGVNPLPLSDYADIYSKVAEMLLLGMLV
jgi:g-D-glutamyl-meso-diaminopimelate peptidase